MVNSVFTEICNSHSALYLVKFKTFVSVSITELNYPHFYGFYQNLYSEWMKSEIINSNSCVIPPPKLEALACDLIIEMNCNVP